MNTLIRNIIAVVLGVVVGGVVNMGLILASPQVIAPPAGVDMSNAKSMAASMHLFEAKHFVFPFLAHALGTLAGALVASLIAPTFRTMMGIIVGGVFLIGGIAACLLIPAPLWFIVLDLAAAYVPMAWIGTRMGIGLKPM